MMGRTLRNRHCHHENCGKAYKSHEENPAICSYDGIGGYLDVSNGTSRASKKWRGDRVPNGRGAVREVRRADQVDGAPCISGEEAGRFESHSALWVQLRGGGQQSRVDSRWRRRAWLGAVSRLEGRWRPE